MTNQKKNIVWISPYAPYDKVGHAGGKNHNFFVKYIQKKNEFNIKLLSICNESEIDKLDLDAYGINNQIEVVPLKGIKLLIKGAINVESKLNPFKRFGGKLSNYQLLLFKKLINNNRAELENAQIVILQWTEALLILPQIKKLCGNDAVFVAIEEDVSFLGYERVYRNENNKLLKLIKKEKYNRLKRSELDCIDLCDIVCCMNDKDRKLLLESQINPDKVMITPSYFQHYMDVNSFNTGFDIMFYGNMGRNENVLAAEWFADNVMPLLSDEYKFYIIGGCPQQRLIKKASSRVIVTGFVDDIRDYLANTLCMVVPLSLGAGIKIKVLEGMSAGKVILTNDVGAEGIPMEAGRDYIHCEKAEEYAEAIIELHANKTLADRIGKNAREIIKNGFDTEAGLDKLCQRLDNY